MKERSEHPFLVHLMLGAFVAAGLSIAAVAGIAFYAVLVLFGAPFAPMQLREVLVGLPLIVASYFVACAIGSAGFWLLSPLRSSVLGWVLSGVLLAGIAYGTVGLTMILGHAYFGIEMIREFTSLEEEWRQWPADTLALALLVGIPGGLVAWYQFGR